MSRTPARATQADIARAIRAVEQVGAAAVVEVSRDGTIRIIPAGIAVKTQPPEIDEYRDIDL
ncbi:hypothetical protein XM25_08080 [Devosia sp. H5989]|nr:hypothetical protein XM25_08080 [Devosia sp. H5989]